MRSTCTSPGTVASTSGQRGPLSGQPSPSPTPGSHQPSVQRPFRSRRNMALFPMRTWIGVPVRNANEKARIVGNPGRAGQSAGDGRVTPLLLGRHELQRDAVYAVALAGRRGAVVEDVAEMAAATGAAHLRAPDAEEAAAGGDVRRVDRLVEARPAGAGIELGLGAEERQAAAGAHEGAGARLVVERAGERPLGAPLPQDAVLLRRQLLAPLRVGLDYLADRPLRRAPGGGGAGGRRLRRLLTPAGGDEADGRYGRQYRQCSGDDGHDRMPSSCPVPLYPRTRRRQGRAGRLSCGGPSRGGGRACARRRSARPCARGWTSG